MIINNEQYSAINVGGKTWMVKWYKDPTLCLESLIDSESSDPKVVTQEAINRGSWA